MGKIGEVEHTQGIDARKVIMAFVSEAGDALDRNQVRVRHLPWPDGRYIVNFRKHQITVCSGFHSIWIDGIEVREIEISYFMDAVYEAWMGQQSDAEIRREQKSLRQAVKTFNIMYGKLAQSLLRRRKKK